MASFANYRASLGKGGLLPGAGMRVFTSAAAATSIVSTAIAFSALAIIAWFWISRDPSVDVATAWGLPGAWQHDCEAPAGPDNPRYRYDIEDGKVLLRRDFGRDRKDTSAISQVEKTPAGELRYVVHFVQLGDNRRGRASRQNILAQSADGRIRTVSNKDADTGVESVVAGVRAEDRIPTPWMSRCKLE